jgi:hypothetical protein
VLTAFQLQGRLLGPFPQQSRGNAVCPQDAAKEPYLPLVKREEQRDMTRDRYYYTSGASQFLIERALDFKDAGTMGYGNGWFAQPVNRDGNALVGTMANWYATNTLAEKACDSYAEKTWARYA